MSDLHELPDLVGDVRDRVVIPPYAEVSRRVRARRLRTASGTVAAAILLVGGVAAWQSVATTAGPSIPQPADHTQGPIPPTDESQWRAVVDGTDSHPFEIEGTDDGSIAVVWRALEPGAPTFALVIRAADGTVHGMRLDEPVSLTPVPGGWVGMDGARGHLIGSDGSWSDLDETAPRQPQAGDIVVTGQYSSWLYSPVDQGLSPATELEGSSVDGYVAPDGRLVTCHQNGRGRIFVSPTDKMIRDLPGSTCVVAGRGDDVAVVALGDDPDGAIPMTGLMTYTGLTWRFPEIPEPLGGVTSVVVTPGGSTVVTDAGDGRSVVVRPDGEVTELDRRAGEAFVAGDHLYMSSYGLMNGPLSVSDDDGRTWQQTTLPGNESKQG
jgi:hypothetical protein